MVYETDSTGKPAEFTFIPCRIRKGANICRHDDNTLDVYIPGIKTVRRLLKEYPGIFKPYQTGDTEATLLFQESLMSEVAKILKPFVTGKGISPRSKRNKRFVV